MNGSMVYEWKNGAHHPKDMDASKIGAHLEKIRSANAGRLTPEAVLADAKKKSSPIHGWFEWDDSEAARQHRMMQARQLIISIDLRFVDEPDRMEVPAFVNTRTTDGNGVYRPVFEALASPDHRREVLERAYRELEAWKRRYAALNELAKIVKAIDEAQGNAA